MAYIASTTMGGDGTFAMSDGDHDGILDISGEIYLGGTAGFTYFVFFKGQPDGTFAETSFYDDTRQKYIWVEWEGREYLVRTSYDYSSKYDNGFDIYLYENGERTGVTGLYLTAKEFDTKVEYEDGYKDMALTVGKRNPRFYMENGEFEEGYAPVRRIIGTGERLTEDGNYLCDLDQSGTEEEYDKGFWLSSSISGRDGLDSDIWEFLTPYGIGQTGNEQMVWVDSYEGKNMICFLMRDGLLDFSVKGYYITSETGEGADPVFTVCWKGKREIKEGNVKSV